MIDEYAGLIKEEDRLGLELGLSEIIINAIEHGNLEISFDEKVETLKDGMDALERLRGSRRGNPDLGRRKVMIESFVGGGSIFWTITDEGGGFDFEKLLDPNETCNLETPCGRGIFLARMQFDSLEFSKSGCRVRLGKRFAG